MLARHEAQMNLMKQAVEVRGQGSEGREGGSAVTLLAASHTHPELGFVDFTDVHPA